MSHALTGQNFVTICCPLDWPAKWAPMRTERLNRLLDTFGNPLGDTPVVVPAPANKVGAELRAKLDEIGTIHFLSLNLIPAEPSAPRPWWARFLRSRDGAWLVLEMSVDGDARSALQGLITEAGQFLLPIFEEAAGITSIAGLSSYLRRHKVELHTNFPSVGLRPNATLGLAFNGAPGLSVKQIKKEARIHDAVRNWIELDQFTPSSNSRRDALTRFARVRAIFGLGDLAQAHGPAIRSGLLRIATRESVDRDLLTNEIERADLAAHIQSQQGSTFADSLRPHPPESSLGILNLLTLVKVPLLGLLAALAIGLLLLFSQAISDETGYLTSTPDWIQVAEIAPRGGCQPGTEREAGGNGQVADPCPGSTFVWSYGRVEQTQPDIADRIRQTRSLSYCGYVKHRAQFSEREFDRLLDFVGSDDRLARELGDYCAHKLTRNILNFTYSISYLAVYTATILILLVSLFALLIRLGQIWLRRAERDNTPFSHQPDPGIVREMMRRENRTVAQNHMVSITRLQPGGHEILRKRLTLPLALRAVKQSILHKWFSAGFLADIGTIHFARWVRLPGTRRLVFFSNYDANWESYLEDFITKATTGLTGIWSNCEGFPRAEMLFRKGAEDGDRFKRWARDSMQPTRVWYSAYPDLSIAQIRRNALVTIGLSRPVVDPEADLPASRKVMDAVNAAAWQSLFDSDLRPEHAIEVDEVQSMILSGGRHQLHGACHLVRFDADTPESRLKAWVRDVATQVTYSDRKRDHTLNIAFTAPGLARLGLAENVSTQGKHTPGGRDDGHDHFPSAFSMGMDDPARERVLGDHGQNHVSHWSWGNQSDADGAVHAIIIVYTTCPDELQCRHEDICESLRSHGLPESRRIDFETLPGTDQPVKEPFGWVDGIGQPILRGTTRGRRTDPVNTVEPGEIILGYRDNRQFFPPTPTVLFQTDTCHDLPLVPADMPDAYPGFQSSPQRDFGRNGSFLVIRQLEQDCEGFQSWLTTATNTIRDSNPAQYGDLHDDFVGAKLFGRWRNGEPLVRFPNAPSTTCPGEAALQADNAFRYGVEDPQGMACPFGAHIRRANPRDSLNPANPLAMDIANRHRILRRGRTYVETRDDNTEVKGTFFMCLNADIERQFEFIQQNWINAPRFHGLDDEVDPITGQTAGFSAFSIPRPTGPLNVTGWAPFVRMRGGGYFFLPSRSALAFLTCS